MKFNKRAAMELGISTVVMLVIAIVIIGAGIAFIRGFFGKGTDSLGGAFEVADFGLEPTAAKPLVLTDGKISIKRGKEETIRVGVYNKENAEHTVEIDFEKCISSVNNTACKDNQTPQIISLAQLMQPGDSAGFATQVTAKCENKDGAGFTDMIPGTYTCNIRAMNGTTHEIARSQITFTVTS